MSRLKLFYLSMLVIFNFHFSMMGVRMQDNQENLTYNQTIPIKFFKRIKYTLGSIKCFLKHTYNDQNYIDKFLPLNFDHMIDFLDHVQKTEEPRAYIKSVVKLFGQKLKSANFINSFAFLELLEKIILLSPYFESSSDIEKQKAVIRENLVSLLNTRESLSFNLDQMTDDLYNVIINLDQEKEVYHLQYVVHQFLEIGLSKLIWSYIDQENCWESVKLIACQLEQMQGKNIITHEMLNELYWTLISRFKYFLDIAGTELNSQAYYSLNLDLENDNLALWALSEKEPYILPKREFLRQAVINSSISARACQEGIISNYNS